MLRSIVIVGCSLLVALLSFFAIVWFSTGIGYQYVAMLIGQNGTIVMGNPYIIVPFYIGFAILMFANALQLFSNKISVIFLKAEVLVYFVLAFAVIMLKSRGVQGFNLNFLDIINQYLTSPFGVIVNLIVFIPMGIIFHMKLRSAPKSLLLAFIIILICESLQYVFHLGIFDIVDIVVNVVGFGAGYLVADVLGESGLMLSRSSRFFYHIKKAKEAHHDDAENVH